MARTPVYLILTHNYESDVHEFFRVPVDLMTKEEVAWLKKWQNQALTPSEYGCGWHNSMIDVLSNPDVESHVYYQGWGQQWAAACRHPIEQDTDLMDPEIHNVRGVFVFTFTEA